MHEITDSLEARKILLIMKVTFIINKSTCGGNAQVERISKCLGSRFGDLRRRLSSLELSLSQRRWRARARTAQAIRAVAERERQAAGLEQPAAREQRTQRAVAVAQAQRAERLEAVEAALQVAAAAARAAR